LSVEYSSSLYETQNKVVETQNKVVETQNKTVETQNKVVETQNKVVVKFSRYRTGVAQKVGTGIALLFHNHGTRRA